MSDSNTTENDLPIPDPDELLTGATHVMQEALWEALQRYRAVKAACIILTLSGKMDREEAEKRMRVVSDLAYSSLNLLDSLLVATPDEGDQFVTRNLREVNGPDGGPEEVVAPNSILRSVEDLDKLPAGCVARFSYNGTWIIAEKSRGYEWFTLMGNFYPEEMTLPAILLAGPVRADVEKAFLT